MYSLNETARREILEQFVARYIDHVNPENNATSEHRSHDVASEILAIGPIQVEGLNIEATVASGSASDHLHDIKVEDTGSDELGHHHHHHHQHHHGLNHHHHGGPKEGPNSTNREQRPPDNIMVELEDTDSGMLLVKW